MTRPLEDVRRVAELLEAGVPIAAIARRAGVPRRTVRGWLKTGIEKISERRPRVAGCDPCAHVLDLPETPYSYLLGLYLGDGYISAHPRDVYRLRITLDARYPGIVEMCRAAMGSVLPNAVSVVKREGCVEVGSYSKHWPCLFPQHGPGVKHQRAIVLEPWQVWVALERHPTFLLQGLIHSDGCRSINRVFGRYEYPRYTFSNRSADIRAIFEKACERAGIECKQSNAWTVSVSKRGAVERMDQFIGPKW